MKILLANPDRLYFLGCNAQPTNYDGKPGTRYTIMLQGSMDAGSLICTPEAFQEAQKIDRQSEINIVGDYSSDYKSFKITGIKPVK